jgi:anti-sigma B factor antagonist
VNLGTQHLDDGTAVIAPEGRLTMTSTAALRTLITETVDGGRTHVVVDLAATDFIDSSGLGALVAGLKTCRQAGGDLRIARPTEQVRTVLQLTNLDRVLRPAASVRGAFDHDHDHDHDGA